MPAYWLIGIESSTLLLDVDVTYSPTDDHGTAVTHQTPQRTTSKLSQSYRIPEYNLKDQA